GLGVCGYELIRELFIFIKLILNSYLLSDYTEKERYLSYFLLKERLLGFKPTGHWSLRNVLLP
ncbi:hypothetical protein AAH134_12500, partial [Bacteroides thetaiotaomicron]|uniref:hypothetical protein n=1 Tax=Bacteroides thetaiotaomicron TaxID=818 RepID=UPI0039B42FE5